MVVGRCRHLVVCIGLAGTLLATAAGSECLAAEENGERAKRALENLTRMSPTGVDLDSRVDWLPEIGEGRQFVKLADGGILTIAKDQVRVTHDEGKTWKSRPMFPGPREDIGLFGGSGLLVRSRNGVIILVSMNQRGYKWGWNDAKNLPAPDARLTVWSIVSNFLLTTRSEISSETIHATNFENNHDKRNR